MCVCVCVCVRTYVCMYVCMYVCINSYFHIFFTMRRMLHVELLLHVGQVCFGLYIHTCTDYMYYVQMVCMNSITDSV